MITRTWRCLCPPQHRDAFLRHLDLTGVQECAALPGYLGHQILERSVKGLVEITLVTCWRSMEDIAAFAGENPSQARLYPGDEAYGIIPETHVRHDVVLEQSMPAHRA
ncbi:MAG: antibiotic biosynthesis monooxygenase family protein [Acidobacteriota bacterium]